jgi:hypothetical protein
VLVQKESGRTSSPSATDPEEVPHLDCRSQRPVRRATERVSLG